MNYWHDMLSLTVSDKLQPGPISFRLVAFANALLNDWKAAMVRATPGADSCLHENFLRVSHCGTFLKCSFPSECTQSYRQALFV